MKIEENKDLEDLSKGESSTSQIQVVAEKRSTPVDIGDDGNDLFTSTSSPRMKLSRIMPRTENVSTTPTNSIHSQQRLSSSEHDHDFSFSNFGHWDVD